MSYARAIAQAIVDGDISIEVGKKLLENSSEPVVVPEKYGNIDLAAIIALLPILFEVLPKLLELCDNDKMANIDLEAIIKLLPVILEFLPMLLELCENCPDDPETWKKRIRVILRAVKDADTTVPGIVTPE